MFTSTLATANSASPSLFKRPLLAAMTAALFASISLAGCSSPNDSELDDTKKENKTADTASNVADNDAVSVATVDIDTVKGKVSLPMNPSPIVVYDMTIMQDLAALDVAIDGKPSGLHLDNLQSKVQPDPKEVGTVFEPDLETLNAMQPQAILVGSRMAEKYNELSNIAPTLDMSIDTANIYESSKQRLHDLGALFGKSDQALKLQQNIDGLIEQTQGLTKGKGNGLVVMVNGNKLSAYGDKSRFGFVHTVLGVPMVDSKIEDARHGQPVSFEYLQKTNPDWLFVIDRSAAIGEDSAGAKAVLDNPLVAQTTAWKKDQVVYLSPDSYLAFGGYNQWMQDLTSIKAAFSAAK
ncbi:siderophore ABC transporter substrate-binding protein [Psychrobacter frigidicola]|uniref:Siderophore ABC transporter substrate-binding protein n=1 Tax=Psychrobacter frigidicola TaxID=45611 RepID=A0A5C7A9R5_9GAMM|nr:siderophore ABC transporter substrate-binding protein [Psychrobacter frigidicola]TXD98416.1 siderophore ABC transporter substrate-binding protein [Psychrobacter frigidicola]